MPPEDFAMLKRSVKLSDSNHEGFNDRIREIIEGKYRIIYTIQSNQIEILAVLHGAQQLEEN